MIPNEPMWLNKFISESGLCSRRKADSYIVQGKVLVNGKRAMRGDQVFVGDRVRVNGLDLEPREADDMIFIALNKPVGITSTSESNVTDNIVDYVNHSKRIFPIGRLDKDSQGLIFLTNNGDIVNKILRAGNKHEKEYLVTVNKPLTPEVLKSMAAGVQMLGVTTKKCKITQEGVNNFRIVLIQGLNRQIRRMCEHFGYEVTRLERVRIMNINLKSLPLGDWRDLTPTEMSELYALLQKSSPDHKKAIEKEPTATQTKAKESISKAKPKITGKTELKSSISKPKENTTKPKSSALKTKRKPEKIEDHKKPATKKFDSNFKSKKATSFKANRKNSAKRR